MRLEGVNTAHKWLNLTDELVALYNAHDCDATLRVKRAMRREMEQNGQWDFYVREQRPLLRATVRMQRRGLAVDEHYLDEVTSALKNERAECEEYLCDIAGKPRRGRERTFWLNSTGPNGGQRGAVLFDSLKVRPAPPTRDRSARSTSQEALEHIYRNLRKMDAHARGFIENLFHYGKIDKLLDYTKLRVEGGRVFPTIKLYKQRTLRFSYTDPPVGLTPQRGRWKRMRDIYTASPGCVLLGADYSQVEARIAAILSNDRPSLEVFASDEDIHVANALDGEGMTLPEWEALDPLPRRMIRDYWKSFLYKITYGGEASSDSQKQFCPCERCTDDLPPERSMSPARRKQIGDRWFRRHPAVRRYRTTLKQGVDRNGGWYLSPFGAHRLFSAPWSSDVERELFDFPMQQSATIIKNRAIIELDRLGAPLWLDHHDAIYLDAPIEEASHWATTLREVMERPVSELDGWVFPVEVEAGLAWGSLRPISELPTVIAEAKRAA